MLEVKLEVKLVVNKKVCTKHQDLRQEAVKAL